MKKMLVSLATVLEANLYVTLLETKLEFFK